jgi:glycosyltransferase involved in cell wall biosynthesis
MSQPAKITIVTPSYNQAPFLERTIRSVLDQGYPNLEYIIMDGGSTDGSVEIIQKYQARLAYWVSAPDKGQADAIYRGFERSTGAILGWLNSDDYYLPGALQAASKLLQRRPSVELVIGNSIVVDEHENLLYTREAFPVSYNRLLYWHWGFAQPATFWRRAPFFETGGFDREMRFCFDYDMYLRLLKRRRACYLDRYLAAFRQHAASKTSTISDVRRQEDRVLHERFGRAQRPERYVKTMQRWFKERDDMRIRWRRALKWLKVRLPTKRGAPVPQWDRPPALREESQPTDDAAAVGRRREG